MWGANKIALNYDSIIRQREKIPATKLLRRHAEDVTWALYTKGDVAGFDDLRDTGLFQHIFDFGEKLYVDSSGMEYAFAKAKTKKVSSALVRKYKNEGHAVAVWGGDLTCGADVFLVYEWTYSERYHSCHFFIPQTGLWRYIQGKNLKKDLAEYKPIIRKLGYDYDALINGDPGELTRVTVESWLKYSERIIQSGIKIPAIVEKDDHPLLESMDKGKDYGILPTSMRIQCDMCILKDGCKAYMKGGACRLHHIFAHYQPDNVNSIIDSMGQLVEEDIARLKRQALVHDSVGIMDETIPKRIEGAIKNLERLSKLVSARDGFDPPKDGETTLGKLFGANQAPNQGDEAGKKE